MRYKLVYERLKILQQVKGIVHEIQVKGIVHEIQWQNKQFRLNYSMGGKKVIVS